MSKKITKALNIEAGEGFSVSILLLLSLFFGIFTAALDITAHTLFINEFGHHELGKAYTASGIAGIILTGIYSAFQKKMKFSKLAVLNLFMITLFSACLRIGFDLPLIPHKTMIYALFILMGPLHILGIVGFWGVVGRLFDLRQGKRLFGLIDTGIVVGSMIIAGLTPLLLKSLATVNLLWISISCIFLAFLTQIIISSKFNLNSADEAIEDQGTKKEEIDFRFKDLFKDRYTRLMATFVFLSMMSAFFVMFLFLGASGEEYADKPEEDYANFFALFILASLIFSLIAKTLAYSKLMKNYGVVIVLMVLPVLLAVFCLVASLVGFLSDVTNILFFLVICLARFFSKSLRESFEQPAFKLFYQSIPAVIRHKVQATIDGTVNEFSATSAGLFLALLGLFSFISLVHYSIITIVVVGLWAYILIKLYSEYQNTLKRALASSGGNNIISSIEYDITDILKEEMKSEKVEKRIHTINLSEKVKPLINESLLIDALSSSDLSLRRYAIQKTKELTILSSKETLKDMLSKEQDTEIKAAAKELSENIDNFLKINSLSELTKLVKSQKTEDKILAAKLIGELSLKEDVNELIKTLLKDKSFSVRLSTINSISKLGINSFNSQLLDALNQEEFKGAAATAFIKLGEGCLKNLEQGFHKSSTTSSTRVQIVSIYGKIGGEQAINLLLKKLDFPDRNVVQQALISLKHCDFKANQSNIFLINHLIEDNVAIAAWNIAAIESIKEDEVGKLLRPAMEIEAKENREILYLLLSLAYDKQSIINVKKSLDSGTSEGIGFGMELLDLFIEEALKPKLFPVLDDISNEQKINALQTFYPLEILDSSEVLLRRIVNRDYNSINLWTKAVALYAYKDLEGIKVTDMLIANLFNPNQVIREIAAVIVNKLSPKTYEITSKRLPKAVKLELDQLLATTDSLLVEKAIMLKNTLEFREIDAVQLIELAQQSTSCSYKKGEIICNQPLQGVLVIENGEAQIKFNDGNHKLISSAKLIGSHSFVHFNIKEVVAETDVKGFYIKERSFFNQMYNHSDVVNAWIELSEEKVEVENFVEE